MLDVVPLIEAGPPPLAWGRPPRQAKCQAPVERTTPTSVGKTYRHWAGRQGQARTTPTSVGKT